MQTKTDRHSGIELLRIISIIGVIILHYNNMAASSGELTAWQTSVIKLTESLFICSVDLFMLISGYFLSESFRRDLLKPMEIYLQIVFFSGASFIYKLIRGTPFSVKALFVCFVPNNYFATLYVCVYILSLYVNLIFDKLDRVKLRSFMITAVGIFCVFAFCLDLYQDISGNVLSGLNPFGLYGSGKGYTFVSFMLAYCVGGYIRKTKSDVKTSLLWVVFLSCTSVTFFGYMYVSDVFLEYLSPFILFEAACVFMLFLKWDFTSEAVNALARGCFMAFLFHFPFLGHIGIQKVISTGNAFLILIHQLLSSCAIFLICRIIYSFYALISAPLTGWLKEHSHKISI